MSLTLLFLYSDDSTKYEIFNNATTAAATTTTTTATHRSITATATEFLFNATPSVLTVISAPVKLLWLIPYACVFFFFCFSDEFRLIYIS